MCELQEYLTRLSAILGLQLVPYYGLTRGVELEVVEGDSPAIEYQASQVVPWLQARRLLLELPSFIEYQLCMTELLKWVHVAGQSASPNAIVLDRGVDRVLGISRQMPRSKSTRLPHA